MSNRGFSTSSQPATDSGQRERHSNVAARSFPGNPGAPNSPLKAKRSLSDDRGKVTGSSLSASPALPGQGLEMEEDGKPLLETAWMSIVGAAGKFLGRAQERHQWSDARMGMMNRLLCKNKSGSSQRAEDEDTFRHHYGQGQGGRSGDKHSMNSLQSHAENDMMLTSISNRASPQVPGRSIDFSDSAAAPQLRDQRGKVAGEFSLPQLSGCQASPSGLGHATDAYLSLISEHDSISRRIATDSRRRQDEARQSGSGSNSTRQSIPMMPPIPRQPQPPSQPPIAAEPSEDHLHDLLYKLRARRLGQEPNLDPAAAASGPGAQTRRGMPHASQELGPQEVHKSDSHGLTRRPPPVNQVATGSRLLCQRYSAHLASDLERQQAKASDAFHSRHSAVICSNACDTMTTNRINSWLAKASPYVGEGPIDDCAAVDPSQFVVGLRKALSRSNTNDECGTSPRCSPEVDSNAQLIVDEHERESEVPSTRRTTHHGVDTLPADPWPVDPRPWRSMNGTSKETAHASDSSDHHADVQGPAPSRTAAPRVQFVSSRLGGTGVKLDLDNR